MKINTFWWQLRVSGTQKKKKKDSLALLAKGEEYKDN